MIVGRRLDGRVDAVTACSPLQRRDGTVREDLSRVGAYGRMLASPRQAMAIHTTARPGVGPTTPYLVRRERTKRSQTIAGFSTRAEKSGMAVERSTPGSDRRRLVLRHDASKVPGRSRIRNIIGNGEMCGPGRATRRGSCFRRSIPVAPADSARMKTCAASGSGCATAGSDTSPEAIFLGAPDPGFPAWHGVEAAIGPVIGRVDAHVVNQHGLDG